jgi:hypothetical protein
MKDTIEISGKVAEALSIALDQDVNRMEQPERMAWILLILKKLPDTESTFPHGKWATIQHIEGQLDEASRDYIVSLPERDKGRLR